MQLSSVYQEMLWVVCYKAIYPLYSAKHSADNIRPVHSPQNLLIHLAERNGSNYLNYLADDVTKNKSWCQTIRC